MPFNSFTFLGFLGLVFFGFWSLPHRALRARNLLLLAASYTFYGWWDPRFLALIAFSSAVDFSVGLGLARTDATGRRRALLACSLVTNLGLLGVFKYFDFFAASFAELLSALGVAADPVTLGLILPVGISFYTFQTLSYTIDVHQRRLAPCTDPLAFFTFVGFFPQLVAGPIERAARLLPQFQSPRRFDEQRALGGARLILWGLFKKVVVADTCAVQVNLIFDGYGALSSGALALGAIWFAFQIYGDFSGYSDIAIGTARLFGFELTRNFAYPYFSRDIAEFWRRWHMSLTSWFRDYVYIPLGGSRGGRFGTLRNVVAIFLLSGLWHGANWTFIVWGALNALYFVPLLLRGVNRARLDTVAADRRWPSLREAAGIGATFALTCLAWIFFRADSLTDAGAYLARLLGDGSLELPRGALAPAPWVLLLLGLEWRGRHTQNPLELTGFRSVARCAVWFAVATCVLWFHSLDRGIEFIYFQF